MENLGVNETEPDQQQSAVACLSEAAVEAVLGPKPPAEVDTVVRNKGVSPIWDCPGYTVM